MADIPKPVGDNTDEIREENENVESRETQGSVVVVKPKSKKKKNRFGVAAPRQPLTGYVRYLNSRRDALKNDNPNLTFADITKILAQEWANLSKEDKRPFQEAGEVDRERYLREMELYKKTDAYKDYLRKQQEQSKQKGKEKPKENETETKKLKISSEHFYENNGSGFDIPIFTEEFLDLNKSHETQLRQLRKNSTDFELQNASLTRIVESMQAAANCLQGEIVSLDRCNKSLSRHMQSMRSSLVAAFHTIPLPGFNEKVSMETVDHYMHRLHSFMTGPEANQHSALVARITGIIDRLPVQLN